MPPASATATERPAGHAPAIGASRIGTRRPYRSQNAAARSRGRNSEFLQAGLVMTGSGTADRDRHHFPHSNYPVACGSATGANVGDREPPAVAPRPTDDAMLPRA